AAQVRVEAAVDSKLPVAHVKPHFFFPVLSANFCFLLTCFFFSGDPRATRTLAAAHRRVCTTCREMPVLNTARPVCQSLDIPKHVTNAALRREVAGATRGQRGIREDSVLPPKGHG